MIAICEPQVIGYGHEAVNSAFIYGMRLAYKTQKIIFYADQSHIEAIKKVFEINNLLIDNIEYKAIKIRQPNFTFKETFYSMLFFKIFFKELKKNNIKTLLLLSISSDGLFGLKIFNDKSIKITMVLHGIFEWLKDPPPYNLYKSPIHKKLFNIKRAITILHHNNLNYVALSPHIISEAKKYIDVNKYNIKPIHMPFIFSNENNLITSYSSFIRFGIIGKGNTSLTKNIVNSLNLKEKLKKYEIKIFHNNISNLKGTKNVVFLSPNQSISRKQIADNIKDVDILLYLYDNSTYKLSCSGSLFEAFAYCKPIIFLSNNCFSYFNKICRIGYECEGINDVILQMEELINHFDVNLITEFNKIKGNIISLRKNINIESTYSSLDKIINS